MGESVVNLLCLIWDLKKPHLMFDSFQIVFGCMGSKRSPPVLFSNLHFLTGHILPIYEPHVYRILSETPIISPVIFFEHPLSLYKNSHHSNPIYRRGSFSRASLFWAATEKLTASRFKFFSVSIESFS